MLKECVTADAALMEAYDLCSLLHCATCQFPDSRKVVCLVGVAMFELGSGNPNISHAMVLRVRFRIRYLVFAEGPVISKVLVS
jgi:hypothetical protein